jgi:hypothetical protein
MWFTRQLKSFLIPRILKEYPSMARSKSLSGGTAGRKNKPQAANPTELPEVHAVAADVHQVNEPVSGNGHAESHKFETPKIEVKRSEPRSNLVPINLEDEIRQRAYELYEQRGYSNGHDTDDWLVAEREILQRYRQQTA